VVRDNIKGWKGGRLGTGKALGPQPPRQGRPKRRHEEQWESRNLFRRVNPKAREKRSTKRLELAVA